MNTDDEIKFLKQEIECLKKQIELLELKLRCKDAPTVIPWPYVDPCPQTNQFPRWEYKCKV